MTSTGHILEKAEKVASRLKLIANSNRLRIACRLLNGEMSVGDIEIELGIRQPTLSREIAKLREGGVITARRQSKVVFYTLTDPDMKALIEAVCLASANTGAEGLPTPVLAKELRPGLVSFNPRPKFTQSTKNTTSAP